MRERGLKHRESLAGSLLVANPTLRDPNFRRSVVLMSLHNAEGAMGVVLNRPLNKRLGELNGEFALGPLAGVALFQGGPVQTEQLLLIAWQPDENGFRFHFGLDPEKAAVMVADPTATVRAFLGYSGWTAGQLEKELKLETWVVADVPSELLTFPADDELWRKVLAGQGEEWKLLAEEPDDPAAN